MNSRQLDEIPDSRLADPICAERIPWIRGEEVGGRSHLRFRSRSAARFAYHPYQPVFDVGFRVLVEFSPDKKVAVAKE